MKPIPFPPESEQPAAPVPGQPFTELDFYGFSKRQRAAIDLRVPNSGVPWLDAMIKEARRLDAAQACLPSFINQPHDKAARFAIGDADALVAGLWPEPTAADADPDLDAARESTAPAPTPSLESLFATAHPACRNEAHPPGDWTENGKWRAVTTEERKCLPERAEFWDQSRREWFLSFFVGARAESARLYRVPTNNGGAS